jgi:PIN domain
VSAVTDERVVRLAPDINVFIADILSRRNRRRATASTRIVDAVSSGRSPAGPVQLVTSLPIIENYANVLERRLGYEAADAAEKAWILEQYAREGPLPTDPYVAVGSGYLQFETEQEWLQATQTHLKRRDRELFNEIQDDRYVLETAVVGRADLLVTCDVSDFCRGPAVRLARPDVVLFPLADWTLVIGTPQFAAYWLGQGVVPDARFVADHPGDFVPYVPPSRSSSP